MKYLVVGYGSIGKRHAACLVRLGCEVHLVTQQKTHEYPNYFSIHLALKNSSFDYVVIANETYLHHQSLLDLIVCDYRGVVLVEKPLFSKTMTLPEHFIKHIFVSYNLRFHELLLEVKQLIVNEQLITFSAYVGQYLPSWRSARDYRSCYSAIKSKGGGVLCDLSHELDYIQWFCGPCLEVAALGGHLSELEISSDDVYSIIMKGTSCPLISLHINYLDRSSKREIIINTQTKTISVDLVKGVLAVDGEIRVQGVDLGIKTYDHLHLAMLNSNFDNFCTYAEGVSIVNLIDAIERANDSKKWVSI